ncbi:PadR family transcriptional regulator [Bacillus sp. V3B]|uniref:PadR family transcriptional regulator n=1 Tax=Bacillus sp. V3B TaxID=2804915 RepID=UPI00210B9074|nr:PadR family transcriptional regulator [Bacillus sp. V3B]MCQ6275821.1 PadR family transcriptional regulator [Bacillus sp. V3B]
MNIINTLGYAIFGALDRKPCSGYELAQYLEVVWPAKHSQIHPMLTKMEQKELLVHEHVEQTGKPDFTGGKGEDGEYAESEVTKILK